MKCMFIECDQVGRLLLRDSFIMECQNLNLCFLCYLGVQGHFEKKTSILFIIKSVFSVEKVNFYRRVEALSVYFLPFFPIFFSMQGFSVTAQADIVLVPVNTYNHSCL